MEEIEDIPPETHRKRILSPPVGMVRRFSVGTLMVLMTFFAVLFSGLKLLAVEPPVFAGVTVFFLGIGLGQMFLPTDLSPRTASFISGGFMGVVSGFTALAVSILFPTPSGIMADSVSVFCAIICVFGGPFGYLAGGLIAGIFLFREREEQ